MSSRRIVVCLVALVAGLSVAASARTPRVDYLRIQTMADDFCGALPPPEGAWNIGGGGCVAMIGPDYTGGYAPRTQEQMVVIGWNAGPNGVPEDEGGDDVRIGPMDARWSSEPVAHEARTGQWCLTDSPDGFFVERTDTWAGPIELIDLTGATNAELTFWHWWNLRYNSSGDRCQVEVRPEGGEWAEVAEYRYCCGTHGVYGQSIIDLDGYAGQRIAIRFLLSTSTIQNGDGWYIDDLRITADGDVVFAEGFEDGLDHWTTTGTWGLIGDVTEVQYLDRNEEPQTYTIGRDNQGNTLVRLLEDGLVVSLPVDLPTEVREGLGYAWIEARVADKTDGVMIWVGAMTFVPE